VKTAVDLFAGLGGFTLAASMAGVRVLWAANHWAAAVDAHAANHPNTEHACQDLHQADWERVPRMGAILASPACQGHSRARGTDRPHHDKTRSTAWAVVSCAEFHRPYVAVVENVPEFLTWSLYPAWRAAMSALGYAVGEHLFDAADAGVPQNRRRAFIVCTRSRKPLTIHPPQQQHVPASSIIDWDAGSWSPVRRPRRAAATLERFEHGRATFGRRFVFSYYGNSTKARSVDRPIGTITTRDRWGVVDGDRMRMLSVDECRRAMGFPAGYVLPSKRDVAVHMLGNAVPPPLALHVINEVRRAA
jgi:DNA (cytosine-5)-methyltransferase 1